METNTILAKNIYILRKQKGLTQEQLAEIMGVSYQAVSKWENEKSLPEVSILPLLADTFGCSIDALFSYQNNSLSEINWSDDDVIRGVVFKGRKILKASIPEDYKELEKITFEIIGDAKQVECKCNVSVSGSISGGVNAGGEVTACGHISGGINACGDVTAGFNISGGINANGEVTAGANITGEIHTERINVKGNITAGTIECEKSINVEGNVEADRISGNVICTELKCERVEGSVTVKKQ